MKLSIAALVAVAFAIAAAVTNFASEKQADPAQPVCSDTCDLAAHQAAMQHGMAMKGMVADDMSGMHGMSSATPLASPQPNQTRAPSRSMSTEDSMSPMGSMSNMVMHGHMTMTHARPANAADRARAEQILQALRVAMEPYKDANVAEAAGYKPFHPEWPLPLYHFTNWHNALANEFSFDPARPTSLMYRRMPGGRYQLEGAMYTAPLGSSLDQLDARVPLSVATWHEHTNLCLPPPGMGLDAFGPKPRFGLAGSITTQEACAQAGGTFKPFIYNWMLHVWPFESDPSKVWASEDNPGTMNH